MFKSQSAQMKHFYFCLFFGALATAIQAQPGPTETEIQETTKEMWKRIDYTMKGDLPGNNHTYFPKMSLAGSYGLNIVSEEFNELLSAQRYLSLEFKAGAQSTGRNIYDQLWRYPEWGVGYYGVSLFNDSIFGMPNAVFAYIDIPFNKWNTQRKWTYSYSIAGGMSYNFRPNNPQDNPLNTLIGSYNNVYIEFGFWANLRMNQALDAKMGLSFVHFSNGASALPNRGMNMIGPKIILQQNVLGKQPEVRMDTEIPKWRKRHGFMYYQAFGSKQIENQGENYFNSTIGFAYKYWASYKGQWIAQTDLFYDRANNSREGVADPTDKSNYWTLGLFAGYEAIYNRWSFVSGWGFNVLRNFDSSGSPYYQRFGVRYRIWDGLAIGAGLKSRTFAADYIEWSIAYNLF